MVAADRTTNTTFYPSNDPNIIRGRVLAYNDDWFVLPYGHPAEVMVSSQDDDDVIVSAEVVSSTGLITLGAKLHDGTAIASTRFDIVFKAILKTQ